MNEQSLVVEDLKQVVQATKEFIRATNGHEVVVLHTGDGMELAFFGGPEAPVRCALEIAKALQERPQIKLRMGVHSGPVYRVKDIKGNDNVAGGGINFAQRVMDCGDGGHILLSSSTAELLVQHSEWAKHIVEIGVAEVKHGARVHLHNLIDGELGNPEIPQKVRVQLQQPASRKKRAGWLWKLVLSTVSAVAIATVLVTAWLHHQKTEHPPGMAEVKQGLSKYPPVVTDVTQEL